MKIQSVILTAGLALASSQAVFAKSSTPADGSYAIDTSHTSVTFSVDHMGYSKVMGRFNELEGSLNVADKKSSSLDVVIKSASVDTNHDKRDDHLRSPDFFNVKQFPTITFSSPVTLKGSEKTAKLKGELELLGVKKPVELTLTKGNEGKDPWGLYRIGYVATTTIKRSEFGMNFMQGGIGDEIDITINFEAVKQ